MLWCGTHSTCAFMDGWMYVWQWLCWTLGECVCISVWKLCKWNWALNDVCLCLISPVPSAAVPFNISHLTESSVYWDFMLILKDEALGIVLGWLVLSRSLMRCWMSSSFIWQMTSYLELCNTRGLCYTFWYKWLYLLDLMYFFLYSLPPAQSSSDQLCR